MRPRRYTNDTAYSFSTCEDGITLPENKELLEDWRKVLVQWDKFVTRDKAKARMLVRRGIPPEIRGEAWKVMSGAEALKMKNPGVFEALIQQTTDAESSLLKDVHRTFPTHKNFKVKEGVGQKALYHVLKAFAIMDPEVGYCQGMSFLCGILVTYLNEIDAFWVLVAILKSNYNLRGLFLNNLPLLKHYLYRFHYLVVSYMPELAKHFDEEGVRPLFYAAEWFSTIFSYNVPLDMASRIWDVFFLEGSEYLFRIGLAILKSSEAELLSLHFDGIMTYLKHKPSTLTFIIKHKKNAPLEYFGDDYSQRSVGDQILAIADKFTELPKTLAHIDKKYQLVKDKSFSENERMMQRRPPGTISLKSKKNNIAITKPNSPPPVTAPTLSRSPGTTNSSSVDGYESDSDSDEDAKTMVKGRKLGGKRHLVFGLDETVPLGSQPGEPPPRVEFRLAIGHSQPIAVPTGSLEVVHDNPCNDPVDKDDDQNVVNIPDQIEYDVNNSVDMYPSSLLTSLIREMQVSDNTNPLHNKSETH